MNTLDYILKKYNIQIGKQYFIDIPEMVGSADLSKLFAELKFNLGVEIGTDQGEFAEVLCKDNSNLHLTCIDPWLASAYEKGEQPESNEDQDFFDKRFKETCDRLGIYNCFILRTGSMSALSSFEDNSLDFVYIDGNHDFLNVAQDIHFWLKKVKPGGVLSGHDYAFYPSDKFNHVKRVVQAYALAYHLLPVFAVSYTNKGLRRDRFRSWFIVKP